MRAGEDWEGPGWLKFIRKRVKVWFVFGRQLFKYFRHKKLQEIFMKETVSDDRERERERERERSRKGFINSYP